jgi:hypothetical protein
MTPHKPIKFKLPRQVTKNNLFTRARHLRLTTVALHKVRGAIEICLFYAALYHEHKRRFEGVIVFSADLCAGVCFGQLRGISCALIKRT